MSTCLRPGVTLGELVLCRWIGLQRHLVYKIAVQIDINNVQNIFHIVQSFHGFESHKNTTSGITVHPTTNTILVFRFDAPNHPNLIPVIYTPEVALRAMFSIRSTLGNRLVGAVKGIGSAVPPSLHEQRTVIEAVGRLISIRCSI